MFNNELWQKPAGGGDFYDHQIANSVRLYRGGDNSGSKLTRTPGSTGTSRRIYTLSTWIKRGGSGELGQLMTAQESASTNYVDELVIRWKNYGENEALAFYGKGSNAGGAALKTNASLRDHSAWYHIMVAVDTTQGTDTNRVKIYLNGELQTLSSTTYPAQNYDGGWGNNREMAIGWGTGANNGYPYDGLMAETIYIDGTAQAVTDLGESKNGVWIPKDPSGLTFGDNGFWLKYESSSDLGNDSSGNNNDFSVTNIAAHDQMTDTPTFNSDSNGGNFATMNPLSNGSNPVLGEGNLMMDSFSGSDISGSLATFALPASSGKWYFECFINAPNSGDNYPFIGLTATTYSQSATMGVSQRDLSINLGTGGSTKNETYVGSITTDFTGVSAYADNTVCGVFVDMDARKLWYAKDGVFTNSGNPQDGTNPNYAWTNNVPLLPHFVSFSGYGADSVLNFGQEGTFAGNVTAGGNADVTGYGNFKYDPGDYKALCSGNASVAAEVDPAQTDDDYPQKLFGAKTYTGTGSSNALTGLGFQPDWTWIKERGGINDHKLTDSTRGVTKSIESNTTALEATDTNGLTAFGTDGFTVGSDAVYNNSSDTYVAWNWRANGGTTSTNTQGSEDSTVQVDPSGSFSIVKWTGTSDSWSNAITLGHGLSAAPNVMLCKKYLGDADQWTVFFSDYGSYSIGGSNAACNSLRLDTNAAIYTNQSYKGFGGVMPTSTVFTVDGAARNGSGDTILAYCFANCEGYIKSGTYVGNGNANGTFVYTGFRPALIMTKSVASTSDWQMFDDKRVGYNVDNNELQANEADAEVTTDMIDILSNGFKMRIATDPNVAEIYVYLALAKNPFKYATAR